MKKALITGITGRDGAYLSKLLLDKGYEVYGVCVRTSDIAALDPFRLREATRTGELNTACYHS